MGLSRGQGGEEGIREDIGQEGGRERKKSMSRVREEVSIVLVLWLVLQAFNSLVSFSAIDLSSFYLQLLGSTPTTHLRSVSTTRAGFTGLDDPTRRELQRARWLARSS